MRAHAAAFLSDVEAKPDSPRASRPTRRRDHTLVCRRVSGGARPLERALALFQPGRDDDLAFRFGSDPGVGGDGSTSRSLVASGRGGSRGLPHRRCRREIAGFAHVGTLGFGSLHAAIFELMRGDLPQVAAERLRTRPTHSRACLANVGRVGVLSRGLGCVAPGAASGGLEDLRRGVDSCATITFVTFDGLPKLRLAEAEARSGDRPRPRDPRRGAGDLRPDRSPRVRSGTASGPRRNPAQARPANPAPAEEAFLTAIAVAKQQGTRSFQLRAALALAKLYQSTGRPAEAHGVLAPALEGFAPPQIPEFADAQALLAALAETEEGQGRSSAASSRLRLQTAYSQAVLWSKGWAANQTKTAFGQISDLCWARNVPVSDFSHSIVRVSGACCVATSAQVRKLPRNFFERLKPRDDQQTLASLTGYSDWLALSEGNAPRRGDISNWRLKATFGSATGR